MEEKKIDALKVLKPDVQQLAIKDVVLEDQLGSRKYIEQRIFNF